MKLYLGDYDGTKVKFGDQNKITNSCRIKMKLTLQFEDQNEGLTNNFPITYYWPSCLLPMIVAQNLIPYIYNLMPISFC